MFFSVICCAVCVWVSDGKTLHGIGQFILANVISSFVLLPLPTQHRRLLPDRGKYNTTTWRSRFSHLSLYLLSLFLFCCSSFQQRRGKRLQPFSSLLLWFSSVFEDWGSTVALTELLLCPRSAKSLILNTLCQFLPLRETNVHLEFIPPSPCAHWLPETQFLSPLKCCVQNGDFLHGKFAQLPAAYPLHKFKECFGVVLEGPFFLTSQPISLCFELRESWAM